MSWGLTSRVDLKGSILYRLEIQAVIDYEQSINLGFRQDSHVGN